MMSVLAVVLQASTPTKWDWPLIMHVNFALQASGQQLWVSRATQTVTTIAARESGRPSQELRATPTATTSVAQGNGRIKPDEPQTINANSVPKENGRLPQELRATPTATTSVARGNGRIKPDEPRTISANSAPQASTLIKLAEKMTTNAQVAVFLESIQVKRAKQLINAKFAMKDVSSLKTQ